MQIEIIWLFICLLFSGFFSGVEVAFFSLSQIDIKRITSENKKHSKLLAKLKENSDRFIISILIGNNVVNVLATAIATKLFIDLFGDNGIIAATAIMTVAILLFGEILPKAYASKKAEFVSLKASPFLRVVGIVFLPLIVILEFITKTILKLVGAPEKDDKDHVDEDAVKHLIEIGQEDGNIKKSEKELIHNVFEFDDTTVGEIMEPRENVTSVSLSSTRDEVLAIMGETGFSRIPVISEDDSNHVVGIVHLKGLVQDVSKRAKKKLKHYVSDSFYIPESKKINTLFKEFQRKKTHLAIVVNEYGGFVGIITLEDVLEELVGEVYDETDVEEKPIRRSGKDTYLVKGDCHVDDFNDFLKTSITEEEDFETISGYLSNHTGSLLDEGEIITLGDFSYEIISVAKNRVLEIRVKKVK